MPASITINLHKPIDEQFRLLSDPLLKREFVQGVVFENGFLQFELADAKKAISCDLKKKFKEIASTCEERSIKEKIAQVAHDAFAFTLLERIAIIRA